MAGATPYTCGSCGAALEDSDGSASRGDVTCRACGTANLLVPRAAHVPPSSLPVPPGFHVECDATTLSIVKRWRNLGVNLLLLLAFLLNGLVWFLDVVLTGPGDALFLRVFSVPSVVIALFLIYVSIAALVNRTTITASANALSVRIGPLPWRGALDVDPSRLVQVYAPKGSSTTDGDTLVWGIVMMRLRGGARRPLLKHVRRREHARFVAETLASFYGLEATSAGGGVPDDPSAESRGAEGGHRE